MFQKHDQTDHRGGTSPEGVEITLIREWKSTHPHRLGKRLPLPHQTAVWSVDMHGLYTKHRFVYSTKTKYEHGIRSERVAVFKDNTLFALL